jgi:hypothetical protein
MAKKSKDKPLTDGDVKKMSLFYKELCDREDDPEVKKAYLEISAIYSKIESGQCEPGPRICDIRLSPEEERQRREHEVKRQEKLWNEVKDVFDLYFGEMK